MGDDYFKIECYKVKFENFGHKSKSFWEKVKSSRKKVRCAECRMREFSKFGVCDSTLGKAIHFSKAFTETEGSKN